MAVGVLAALVPVAILGFVLVPGGLERSLGCDLELALRLGMAREMIGERRDGFGVKVERMQFLRNDAGRGRLRSAVGAGWGGGCVRGFRVGAEISITHPAGEDGRRLTSWSCGLNSLGLVT